MTVEVCELWATKEQSASANLRLTQNASRCIVYGSFLINTRARRCIVQAFTRLECR
jgi:hypothetical protein